MSIAPESIDRARQSDILVVAQRYGALKRAGAGEYAGPCPVCGGTDRFSVNTRKGVWNCRGCGEGGDAIKLVRHVERVTFAQAIETLTGEIGTPTVPPAKPAAAKGDSDYERRQHKKAGWLWGQRSPPAGTIAETYLREARCYGGRLPDTLGFLKPSKPQHHPALIAAFAMPEEAEPAVLCAPRGVGAVHLILLKPDGSDKADVKPNKITVGSPYGLPIVLSPVNDLLGLTIHEGIEDALSAYEATGLGAWASASASFMPALADAIPSYVECVTIGLHKDEAGQAGAQKLARRIEERRRIEKKPIEILVPGDV